MLCLPPQASPAQFYRPLPTSIPSGSGHLGWEETVSAGVATHSLRQGQLLAGVVVAGARGTRVSAGVDLVVHVLAGVHVEAGVEEGAVAQRLVRVLVDDAPADQGGGWARDPDVLAPVLPLVQPHWVLWVRTGPRNLGAQTLPLWKLSSQLSTPAPALRRAVARNGHDGGGVCA